MADEFLEQLGQIALGAAWLEDLLAEFIHVELGTKKAEIFTKRMNFSSKCDNIIKLTKSSKDKNYTKKIENWVSSCRLASGERNKSLHSKHVSYVDGAWQRIENEKETDISSEDLKKIRDSLIDCYYEGKSCLNYQKNAAIL